MLVEVWRALKEGFFSGDLKEDWSFKVQLPGVFFLVSVGVLEI